MADYTFFFNPMSRALIAKWAFAEAGVEPDVVTVEWEDKPAALLEANPMGKLPTIVDHAKGGDVIVTEAAAICHYLAEMEAPDLLPRTEEKAAYFRWMFFAAGPLEQAITARSMGWETPLDKQGMAGFGSFDRTMDALDGWLSANDFATGSRFTMADVYLGSQVDWGLQFGTIATRDSFAAYKARFDTRDAYIATFGALGDGKD